MDLWWFPVKNGVTRLLGEDGDFHGFIYQTNNREGWYWVLTVGGLSGAARTKWGAMSALLDAVRGEQ